MMTSLSLELEAPRIRREAFPWGAADAELPASLFASTATSDLCRTRVHLPSVVDLSGLVPPEFDNNADNAGACSSKGMKSLNVELLACDHGITFALGTASIELPARLKPHLDQTACRSDPFRVCLKDDTGAIAGTLGGVFWARRRVAADLPSAMAVSNRGDIVGSSAAVSHGQSKNSSASQEILPEENASRDEETKHNDEGLQKKAIELLDMASKILASSGSLACQRAATVSGPAANTPNKTMACESQRKNDVQVPSSETQVIEDPPKEAPGDSEAHVSAEDSVSTGRPQRMENSRDGKIRVPTAGFRFEPTTGCVEWHQIAAANVSKIERDGDLQTLKQFLPEIAVGRVDEDDVDANIGLAKAFRLAQLQTQYVLHCQQIFQGQCDGLQTAVTNMQLEIEGNLQCTTAMKNRVRLLRKESRKQDKIISGYASLLRRHNPGLASKVRLDERGRLRVFKVDEASPKCGHRDRGGTRRRKNYGIDGLEVLRVRQSEGTDDTPADFHSPLSANYWPEAERSKNVPLSDGLQPHAVRTASFNHKNDKAGKPPDADEAQNSHRRKTITTSTTGDAHEACRDKRDRLADATTNDIHDVEPHRSDRTVKTHGEEGEEGKLSLGDLGSRREERPSKLFPPDGAEVCVRDGVSLPYEGDQKTTVMAGSTGAPEYGSRAECNTDVVLTVTNNPNDGRIPPEKAFVVGSARGGEGMASLSGEGARVQPFDVAQGRGGGSDGEADAAAAEDNEINVSSSRRAARIVTVSVKPMNPLRESTSISPHSTSTQKEKSDKSSSEGDDPILSTSKRPTAGHERAGRGSGGKGEGLHTQGVTEEKIPQGDKNTHLGLGSGNRLVADGEEGQDFPPAASAARLGLDQGGLPDVLDFSLDDISEIDAGGEWGADEAGGSLSSSSGV